MASYAKAASLARSQSRSKQSGESLKKIAGATEPPFRDNWERGWKHIEQALGNVETRRPSASRTTIFGTTTTLIKASPGCSMQSA
jgi:hypothetical protein